MKETVADSRLVAMPLDCQQEARSCVGARGTVRKRKRFSRASHGDVETRGFSRDLAFGETCIGQYSFDQAYDKDIAELMPLCRFDCAYLDTVTFVVGVVTEIRVPSVRLFIQR